MPGGAADPGEELHDAAKREVFEETGIRTEVVSLLCFRTAHEFQFGRCVNTPPHIAVSLWHAQQDADSRRREQV